METVQKWISPQSIPGSVLSSIGVHGILCVAIVVVVSAGGLKAEKPRADVSMDYQMLDAPPVVEAVKKVARLRPAETTVQTPTPVKSVAQEIQDAKSDIAGTQGAAKAETSVASEGAGTADAVPFYKVKPKYPRAALVAGDEGWILLKVDIRETGEVENVRVVDGEKRNLFGEEARRAVEKWKYRPFVNNQGQPIRKADHQVRVDFKLQDA